MSQYTQSRSVGSRPRSQSSSPQASPARPEPRVSPSEACAAYADHALRRLNGISRKWAGSEVATSTTVADIKTMCYFDDLKLIYLQACRGQTILAQWVVRVYPTGYKMEEPLPKPADFVLRSASFQVVVERTGREHLYANLLRGSWNASQTRPDHEFTGTVITLPRTGQNGVIASGNHRNVLLYRDARGLAVGDVVRFVVAWDSKQGQSVAHSIARLAGGRAA